MSDISGIWRLINNEKNKFFLNTILFNKYRFRRLVIF